MIQAPEGFQAPGPPLRHAVDPPLAVDAQVARERLRALYDRTPQALVGAYVFGALLAWAVVSFLAALRWFRWQ